MQATGVFQATSKAYKFRPLFNTSKKGHTHFTRERMVDKKSRTPPYSARKIYGKVPAKIFHTLFRKVTGRWKQDNKIFAKIWGKITR